MKCRKQIVLTGYRVQFVDLREPKPRTTHEETYVADSAWIEACGLLGVVPADRIRDWYEAGGYKVTGIETIKPKRVIALDLLQLWETAGQPTATGKGGQQMTKQQSTAVLPVYEGISADFVLVTTDNSMRGCNIFAGDFVYIRQQDEAEFGDIVAIQVDGKTFLRELQMDDDCIFLVPGCSTMASIVLPRDDCETYKILGKAVAIFRDLEAVEEDSIAE